MVFAGPQKDPRRFLGAADAFVLPSHQENFGVAVAEALAVSAREGLPRYETLQPLYNLFDRAVFDGLSDGLKKIIMQSPEYLAVTQPQAPAGHIEDMPSDSIEEDIPF